MGSWEEGRRPFPDQRLRQIFCLTVSAHTHWPSSGREKLLWNSSGLSPPSQSPLPTSFPLITVREDNVRGKYFYGS